MHSQKRQSFFPSYLFALFIRCPFSDATAHCPFAAIRRLRSLEMRFRLAEQLADDWEVLAGIWETHNDCYHSRLAERMAHIPPKAPSAARPRSGPAAGTSGH
ncbi:hypothetical protein ACUUL3_03500 [Thiovibrio sp. JS02]